MTGAFIPFHRPSIGRAERSAVDAVLASGWLTMGERTREFEKQFAEFVGARNAVALNSATAALQLAFEGIGVADGAEVIVPTYTFAASAETILYCRAKPVLVDVDEDTLNLSSRAVAAALTPSTAAVEVVHVAGLPADISNLELDLHDAARRSGLDRVPPFVEDAAHAFPSRMHQGGRFAGTCGRAGAYSFYATKTITTGEGGMLVTDDDELAEHARMMRLHGISHDAWNRYGPTGTWYYEIQAAGYKLNPTDISAALGLAQLGRADELKARREKIAATYIEGFRELADRGDIRLPAVGQGGEHAWHLFVLRLTGASSRSGTVDTGLPGVAGLPAKLRGLASQRARTIERLRGEGIGTSVHFIPLHLHPLYRSMGYAPGDFPTAERAYAGAISLPIWPGMSRRQVARVVRAVRKAVLTPPAA